MLPHFSKNTTDHQRHQEALLNHGKLYLWSLDCSYRIVTYNQRTAQYVAKKTGAEIFPGQQLEELLASTNPQARDSWMENLEKVRQKEESKVFYYTNLEPKRLVSVRASIQPIFGEKNILTGYSCAFEDQTKLFLINRLNSLKSQFKSQALAIDSVSELLWSITDNILAKLYLEDAIILMLEGDELRLAAAHGSKRSGQRATTRDLRIPIDKGITGYVASKGKSLLVNDTQDDQRYFAEHFLAHSEVAVPITVNGQVRGVINCESGREGFFYDVHQQLLEEVAEVAAVRIKQIEDTHKLQELDKYHRAVLDSTPNGYLLFDIRGNLLNYNRTAAQSFERLLQVQLKPGMLAQQIFPREYLQEFQDRLKQASQGQMNYLEVKHLLRSRLALWLQVTFAPAPHDESERPRVTLLVENTTQLKQNERILQKTNQDLRKTNQDLDHFVYSISHNLRAPLSSIMGLQNLIQMSEDIEEIHDYTHMLIDATESIDSYIRNTLDYARNNRTAIQKRNLCLSQLLSRVKQKLRFLEGYEEITFEESWGIQKVYEDPYRLEIILVNLISNAIKYRSTERTPKIVVRSKQKANRWLLTVQDNGQGIASEDQKNLFHMFFKASSQAQGSGLGLYILRETVQSLDGEVEVYSRLDLGTQFTIALPH